MNAPFNPEPAAAALIAAREAGAPAGPLPAAIAPQTPAHAAAVQHAVAARRGVLPPGGFKIGATGKRMQEFLGIDHPEAGFMAPADIHPTGATLPYRAFRTPQVECELAVLLARDLPPGPCTPEAAAAAVGGLFAAIEIVENRYGKPPVGDVARVGLQTVVADQFYHAAAVIGPPLADWHAMALPELIGRLTIDGKACGEGSGAELLGHPLRGLAWLAASPIAAAFGGLRAGQVVLLGSVIPSIILPGPCEVAVTFAPLKPAVVRFT